MILEPAGLGGGKFSLLKMTQSVLKAAEGASCLALEVPALPMPCSQPSAEPPPALPRAVTLPIPGAVSLYRKYWENLSFAASLKFTDPFRLYHHLWQWAAPKSFPGTWGNSHSVAKYNWEKNKKHLPLSPLYICVKVSSFHKSCRNTFA